jgi:hypothetical protein
MAGQLRLESFDLSALHRDLCGSQPEIRDKVPHFSEYVGWKSASHVKKKPLKQTEQGCGNLLKQRIEYARHGPREEASLE